jgi:hypothetical protein
MLPIAIGRILVDAAPHWIHEIELGSERLARHALKIFVTAQRHGHATLDDVPVGPFLRRAPTASAAGGCDSSRLQECAEALSIRCKPHIYIPHKNPVGIGSCSADLLPKSLALERKAATPRAFGAVICIDNRL